MPLYLERSFSANYRMVTMIPVVFGTGKWIANLPTGYLLGRLDRQLMISGLLLIALVDGASITVSRYDLFLGLRGLGGLGWAMFATVATTTMVNLRTGQRRGRAVSLLMMSETAGLLLGSVSGGWLYQDAGVTAPFLFEAGCMVVGAVVIARSAVLTKDVVRHGRPSGDGKPLRSVLRTPGVLLMAMVNALLTAIQTGAVVFLLPLYLVTRGGMRPHGVGLLVGLSVLGRLVALWVGGGLSDRWGRLRTLIPGLLLYAALLAALACATNAPVLCALNFSMGVMGGLVAPIPIALTSDRLPPSLHGVAIGWLRTVTDGGQIAGPLIMGALADAIDLSAPFLLAALLLAVAALGCTWRSTSLAPLPATRPRER